MASPETRHIGVAMSGGVDSAVAALLLRERGHSVTGFTMNLRNSPADQDNAASARAVCEHIGIPHNTVGVSTLFKELVMRYFCDAYLDGLTPNPCVVCNRRIKFGALWDAMRAQGMEAMATGHYATLRRDVDGAPLLCRGRDPKKDQSYFMYRIERAVLESVVFPNAELTKSQVRELAARAGLPNTGRTESQEVCFVPRGGYSDFVTAHAPGRARPGDIVDTAGAVLGRHDGVHLYTVGQRRGLGIAAPEPLYVLRIEPDTARVVVAPDAALFADSLITRHNVFAAAAPPPDGARLLVKIRYNTPPSMAALHHIGEDAIQVRFDTPQRAITPGQSAVFYDDDVVLGGGIITTC